MKDRACSRAGAAASLAAALAIASTTSFADITVGSDEFTFVIGDDARPRSLVLRRTGEEMLAPARGRPLFSVTQERPFNNEVKLSHPNSRTTYRAKSVRRDGDLLTVAFEQAKYEALVRVRETSRYVAFTLEGFAHANDAYSSLKLDSPPVCELRLLELPVKRRDHLGGWLNVMWDDSSAVAVIASSVNEIISHEKRDDGAALAADAYACVKMAGTTAILVASETPRFLDCIDAAEVDFGMPRGVASRRSKEIKQSSISIFVTPATVDEAIDTAKKGGFKNLLVYYASIVKTGPSWGLCGNYDFLEEFPNGYDDVKAVVARIKAAGLTPGLHFLSTHIGLKSRYVTPVADHRLGLKRRYTLARPLKAGDTTVYVEEDPGKAPETQKLRILKFGGELVSYEGRSSTRPYAFTGVVRGALDTRVVDHPAGEIGGVLDVSEYGGGSCYLDQDTSLADEVADKIAALCNCGFEYLYMDGAEGVKPPYGHYVALAQKRVWDRITVPPKFAEGAAKAHFSWHMLSGANAYDVFAPDKFERCTALYPVEGAKIMAENFSQVDFGWWAMFPPKPGVHDGTTPEMWEWGFKLAVGYDAPVTFNCGKIGELRERVSRVDELLAVAKRWLDAREAGFFTDEMKARLRDTSTRHTLVRKPDGGFELKEIPL